MAREKKKSKNPHEYRGNIWYAIFSGIVGIIVGYLGIKFIREGQVIAAIITFLGLIMAAVIGAIAQVKKKEFKKELLTCLIGLSIGVIVGGIFGYVSSIHRELPPEVRRTSEEVPSSPSEQSKKELSEESKIPTGQKITEKPDPNNGSKQRKFPDYRVIIKEDGKEIINMKLPGERPWEIRNSRGGQIRVRIEQAIE
jgi:hypothetical protein